jgi:hypothetical protein
MKAKILIIIGMTLMLTSCSYGNPDRIRFDGKDYTVQSEYDNTTIYSMDHGAISAGESFEFIIKKNKNGFVFTYNNKDYILEKNKNNYSIIYPNMETILFKGSEVIDGDLSKVSEYPSINEFQRFINNKHGGGEFHGDQFLFGIILLILGIVSVVNPEATWFLNRGWMYKNTEPSELYLAIVKVTGVIGCFVGVVLWFSSCSS